MAFKVTTFSLIFCFMIMGLSYLFMKDILVLYNSLNLLYINLTAARFTNVYRLLGLSLKLDTAKPSLPFECCGLCHPNGEQFSQEEYVEQLIHKHMIFSSQHTVTNSPPTLMQQRNIYQLPDKFNFTNFWGLIDNSVKPRSVWSKNGSYDFALLAAALSTAKILRATTSSQGSQLKSEFILEGGKKVIWKPGMYSRLDVVIGTLWEGYDRHNGEIAAFHLSQLLNLPRVPPVIGRKVHLSEELMTVADVLLNKTFFSSNHQTCFYGQCRYCRPESAACSDEDGYLEGAAIYWLTEHFTDLKQIENPWSQNYTPGSFAEWQKKPNFCLSMSKHEFFRQNPIFADLIETSIFDYLIGNADRHHFEYFTNIEPKMILLIDNGKSFGNPDVDEISILAPVFQCCKVRWRFYQLLIKLGELNLGQLLNKKLVNDPLYPILTDSHLDAINRRLQKVLVLLAFCIDKHGSKQVLINDHS